MEKSGSLFLTQQELSQIQAGVLPQRIAENWGLSYTEAQQMIDSGQYRVVVNDEVNDKDK
jgi:ATP:corrinoid adenosyltransferase